MNAAALKSRGFRRTALLWALAGVAWLTLGGQGQAQEARYAGRTFLEWQRELRDQSPEVRAKAAEALGHFGPPAVPLLAPALADQEFRVRAAAAEALRTIGPAVLPAMIRALEHSDVRIRANAAVVLGGLGPAAREAVPSLARALKDANARVRELAVEAIDKIMSTDGSYLTAPLNCH